MGRSSHPLTSLLVTNRDVSRWEYGQRAPFQCPLASPQSVEIAGCTSWTYRKLVTFQITPWPESQTYIVSPSLPKRAHDGDLKPCTTGGSKQ